MRRYLLLFWLILASNYSLAQPKSLPPPEAYFSAIIVNDINISIRWYEEAFGFEVINKIESAERGFKQANLKAGNILIELIELESSISSQAILDSFSGKTKIDGFFKFGIQISEFDKWTEYLASSNIEFHGSVVTDPATGLRMLIVMDPDGNRIQLFEK